LSLRDPDLGSLTVPREWTDWATPDRQVCTGGASLIVDAFGLIALAELIDSLDMTKSRVDR
jgi:Family of unknown function (DUF5372)